MTKPLEWTEQADLIQQSIKQKKPFHQLLFEKGHSYDDLRYYYDCEIDANVPQFKSIEKLSLPSNDVPLVSFFSGCGGLDLGFESAGFEHTICIDNNRAFCDTLRLNRPKWRIHGPPSASGDVSDRATLSQELKKYVDAPFNGVFIGGPPCQPFSIAANQRFKKKDDNFKRVGFSHAKYGGLLSDYAWFIKEFKPKAFLIENVTGLLTIDGGEQLRSVLAALSNEGYKITEPTILNAANYGVPQYRERLFVVGSQRKTFDMPTSEAAKVPCGSVLNKAIGKAQNHLTRNHSAASIKRYMMLKCGQRDHLGRVNRLNPNKPSLTIIAGGLKGGGRSHLHPQIPRTLSVRESARLQTFPDSFVFNGPMARQFTQVGNAVPPILAHHLGAAMAEQLFDAEPSQKRNLLLASA